MMTRTSWSRAVRDSRNLSATMTISSAVPASSPLIVWYCASTAAKLSKAKATRATLFGLATAAPGEPPRRIAWKAFARNDKLMVKQFSAGEQQARVLSWDSLPKLDSEQRLSQLTRWCLEASERDLAIGLELPNLIVPVGRGQKHLNDCLRALALFNEGART